MVLTSYVVLAPVRPAFVSPSLALHRGTSLAPATRAPGPHAFAVRFLHRSSNDAIGVHRIPPHDRDDAFAPLAGTGCRYDNHNFRENGSRIFFSRGLDSISENQPVGQITLCKSLKRRDTSRGAMECEGQCAHKSNVRFSGRADRQAKPPECRLVTRSGHRLDCQSPPRAQSANLYQVSVRRGLGALGKHETARFHRTVG
jgi:hypothetical protein